MPSNGTDWPKIYYHGERHCRSLWSFIVMCLVGFPAISFIGAMVTHPRWFERSFGAIVAAVVAYFAIPVVIRFARNDHDAFEIRSDGIFRRGTLIPWTRIRQLGAFGKPDDESVSLFYSRWPWRTVPPLLRELRQGRRMSQTEFQDLTLALRRELGDQYPALAIGHYADFSDGG